jgi:HPr kinase/phosphorylase
MNEPANEQIHATCVAHEGQGVLLLGEPGAGKSDLALRLIDAGWELVADDRVELTAGADGLVATAPAALAGLLEVRGLGILRFAAVEHAAVALCVELVAPDAVPRLPDDRQRRFLGHGVPVVALAPFQAGSVKKVQLALALANGSIMRADEP